MLLSVATIILLSPQHCASEQLLNHAEKLFKTFIQNFVIIYGKDCLSYNVHSLLHVAEDARQFSVLDNISAFKFENYLGKMKKMVRRPSNPVAQIVRRISEKENFVTVLHQSTAHKKPYLAGPLPAEFQLCRQYKQYRCNNIFIAIFHGDNYFLFNNKVLKIRNILLDQNNETFVVCDEYLMQHEYNNYPFSFSLLGISFLGRQIKQQIVLPANVLTKKLAVLPFNGESVCIPLLHQQ